MAKIKLHIVMASVALVSTTAIASTPQAWAALDGRVNRACLLASGLRQATIVTDKASFADRVPIELRIVEGYNAQSVIDARLCAYDRRTRRASTVEGSGRLGVYRN